MNISKYFKDHELKVKDALLKGDADYQGVLAEHLVMISRIQHERLIHLLVTLSFALFLFILLAILAFKPTFWLLPAIILIAGLLIPYVGHYFFLENTAQYWYKLADQVKDKVR